MCAYYNNISISDSIGEPGTPIAAINPLYEIATPQYPIPQPYALAQLGYRRNEVVFSCVEAWMEAISDAPLMVYSGRGKDKKPVDDHPLLALLERPNEAMNSVDFWMATECYLNIAGFCVWEKEYNRMGDVIHLWPMRPDWCSFRRGDTRPLEYVRYQPWGGIPFTDVPIERCIVFMEFDPIWPMLKGFSRTAAAMRVLGVDNSATDFLKLFFDHGAVSNGIIKTKQSLQQSEATRIKQLWREQHGGASNWQDVTVLGSDIDYIPTQMNFKDMGFENIDGRNEARICHVFKVPPIVINAKVGMGAMTYHNYQEARKAWYEMHVTQRWNWLAQRMKHQLLADFEGEDTDLTTAFDISEVKALQEDRDAKVNRAEKMAARNLWTRDEARREVGDEPVDGGNLVFVGITAKAVEPPSVSALVFDPSLDAQTLRDEAEQAKQMASQAPPQVPAVPAQIGAPPATGASAAPPPPASDQFNNMVKQYAAARKMALASVGRGVGLPFDDELAACKTAGDVRAVFEKHWPRAAKSVALVPTAADILIELRAAREALERFGESETTKAMTTVSDPEPVPTQITLNIPPPIFNVTVPVSPELTILPAPVNVTVPTQPQPEINILPALVQVSLPHKTIEHSEIHRDSQGRTTGSTTVTEHR